MFILILYKICILGIDLNFLEKFRSICPLTPHMDISLATLMLPIQSSLTATTICKETMPGRGDDFLLNPF